MTTARARHYSQPLTFAELQAAERCDHGEIAGRCALCRRTAEPGDNQPAPKPARKRPTRRRAARDVGQPAVQPELFTEEVDRQ
jgi:hypothetical protein